MKKYEIIEEGRLNDADMAQVKGGDDYLGEVVNCGLPFDIGTYTVSECYTYVTCTFFYMSCIGNSGAKETCILLTYSGSPGPGGAVTIK